MGHIVQRLEASEIGQVLLHRGEALALDGGGVHEGVEGVAQLALIGGQLAFRLLVQLVHDRGQALLAEDLQILEGAGGGTVGGNLRRLQPAAIHMQEEIVARLNRRIDGAEIDAPFAQLGLGGQRGGNGDQGAAEEKKGFGTGHGILRGSGREV
jgi:hypothetical protein